METTTRTCPTHGVTYSSIEQCGECRTARGISVKSGAPKADASELRVREGEYREVDKYLRRLAREWLDDGTSRDRRDALEAFKVAARYAGLSLQIHTSVKELEHDQWLVEQKRALTGGN